MGYRWGQNPKNVMALASGKYIYLSWYSEGLLTHSFVKGDNLTIITTEDLFKDDSLKVYKHISVNLNTEYTATLQPDHVEVGCQKFSFDSIIELYNEVIKIKR